MNHILPNTGMAVTIDAGDPMEVHYRNKQPVGHRLALWALARVYNKDIVYSGQLYESMKVEGNKIRIKFRNVVVGLTAKDGALKQFIIAGKDKQFVSADAKIDGDSVLVWSDIVAAPVAVRYAWLCNPEGCNLYNKSSTSYTDKNETIFLPASPFRTDNWERGESK